MSTAIRTTDEVMCPKCGGRTWDNRSTKRNPKAPDYKCRDRSCDGAVWPPKDQQNGGRAAQGKQGFSSGPALPGEMPAKLDILFALYGVCLGEAIQQAGKLDEAQIGSSPETVASMAATMFIAASKL